MKFLMTRWKVEPSYPKPFSPVARALLSISAVVSNSVLNWMENVPEVLSRLSTEWLACSRQRAGKLQSPYLWNSLAVQSKHDPAQRLPTPLNIKVNLYTESQFVFNSSIALSRLALCVIFGPRGALASSALATRAKPRATTRKREKMSLRIFMMKPFDFN